MERNIKTPEIDANVVEEILLGTIEERWHLGVCYVILEEDELVVYGEADRPIRNISLDLDDEYDEEWLAEQVNEAVAEEVDEL